MSDLEKMIGKTIASIVEDDDGAYLVIRCTDGSQFGLAANVSVGCPRLDCTELEAEPPTRDNEAVRAATDLARAYRAMGMGSQNFISCGVGADEAGNPKLYAYWSKKPSIAIREKVMHDGFPLAHKIMGRPRALASQPR